MSLERPLEPQFFSREQHERASQLGMWIFLSTEVLFFGGLFVGYLLYRWTFTAEFHDAARSQPVGLGTANTFVLITSSLLVALADRLAKRGRDLLCALCVSGAALLGVTFLVIKGVEYAEHIREGALPGIWYHAHEHASAGAAMFFTLYWLMTGLHALHVTIGIVLLGWVAFLCVAGSMPAHDSTRVEVVGMYWHFVDVVWVFLYPLFYLLGGS